MFVKSILLALLGCTLVSNPFISGAQAQSSQAPSLLSGAFSEAQATRGQALYYQHCLACHGEMMNGLDQAPPLAGPQFSSVWTGEPLWALVNRIDTMPPDKPGKLTRAESVDVLTYLLWFNGLPLGTATLAPEQSILSSMIFETVPLTP